LSYAEFLDRKAQAGAMDGFTPLQVPNWLFGFQHHLVDWSIRKGRAAIFADCGLGKTPMQLVWAQNVVEHTNRSVLVLTPLAVAPQTVQEAEKFGMEARRSRGANGQDKASIIVTNYEQLHHFDAADFGGVVCDESSILKHFGGATQKAVTRFMLKVPHRLLCTATAAPNDYIELGTSSEALGYLGHSDMLSRFFRQTDNKMHRMQQMKEQGRYTDSNGKHFAKLSFRVAQSIGQWRLKGHAETPFWQWISSWARACRKPSDLGFDDDGFILPELRENNHVVEANQPADGMLFNLPAIGLNEERAERRRTLDERCAMAADLCASHDRSVIWCHLNAEGDLLERMIPGARQIAGRTPDDEKEEIYRAFTTGEINRVIIKPKIGAWGLNWQHCAHVVTFATHSWEQYYQAVRRCWRYGQTRPVTVDIISTDGEARVKENMQRKAEQAAQMFDALVREMNNALHIERRSYDHEPVRMPPWL